ncbi:hypothetical protein [Aurantiacibacter rhizosphaerae]|uniref:Uncharacterized protein n=1 Tax=Aurantiacibacter rhizosphaerae TaxID=2691582 RepID=A0A844XAP5_9SPHN|nr:hypothetical protein [Aurantiacibacter rhizosphaerae]MWV26900.1 hypothetical protein [Aurantiacibacter rhizosphaerae]
MFQNTKTLLWAAAMIALALAVKAGLIASETAEPMFVALPALAILSIGASGSCFLKSRCAA